MALVSLGPEDEQIVFHSSAKRWLWPQRATTVAVIGAFMLRRRNAHLDNAVNIPMAFMLVFAWSVYHYVVLARPLPAQAAKVQLARSFGLTVCGLAIYVYIQEKVGPYWIWHSIWHLLCSLGSFHILRTKHANAVSHSEHKVATD
mmetsp:Transcript_22129/g.69575  ORF Transcript_22129/g.69575 Transcript_22129/m.69575 type:complete len:145 (+) Transcript_22129:2-436(+)